MSARQVAHLLYQKIMQIELKPVKQLYQCKMSFVDLSDLYLLPKTMNDLE